MATTRRTTGRQDTRATEAQAPFAQRRAALAAALVKAEGQARGPVAAIFASGHEAHRNGDVDYEFRQPSTFWYLTGFEEPDAVAVIRPGHPQPYALFVRPHDPQMAVWVGPRAGIEGAQARYGADVAYSIDDLEKELPGVLDGVRSLYFSFGADEKVERLVTQLVAQRRAYGQRGGVAIERVGDPFPFVAAQRLIKSSEEIAALQEAIDITGKGIEATMRATRPGLHEYELQSILEAEYRRLGSPRNGFPSIVATGANACTLHYTSNRAQVGKNDLVLLDTGAEVDYYGADVSRTYPASGTFTPEQRAVYDIVLEAQRQAIELVAPGVRFIDVHQRAVRVLVDGLRHLGILEGRTDKLVKDAAYQPYYMHATSHWLGLDVHDVGAYREDGDSTKLRAGMVLTVEPGLYISPGSDAPKGFHGIGVRIEDDILVTRNGYRNLSSGIPRDPETLQDIVRG